MSRFTLCAIVVFALIGCERKRPAATAPALAPVPEPVASDPPGRFIIPVPPDDGPPPPRLVQVRTADEALREGVAWLLAQQSEDGAWRSDVYATFKDGTALTPLVVTALQEAHRALEPDPKRLGAIHKGLKWLARFTKDGTVNPPPDGFDYPVYTAALTLQALSNGTAKEFGEHRAPWVKYLKERQLTETHGWKEEDKQYGGWGYCRVIPKKPEVGALAPSLIESNLSATLFALDALKAAGEADTDTRRIAAVFVRRCQNWRPPVPGVAPPEYAYMDGGFHFIYDDPTRNKAGTIAPAEPLPRTLFYSYGSTTADGLRALALCGHRIDDPDRRGAALGWFRAEFRADRHPGTYVQAHERNRDAVYFYYAASVARALGEHKLEFPDARDWRAELSSALAARQAKDGSWANPIELVRENDPVVATSNAVLALARCRR